MNSSKAKSCLVLLFWITSSVFGGISQPATASDIVPPNNIVIVPGTAAEKLVLVNSSDSWVENGVRITNDFFEYKLPLLTTAPFVLDFDTSGPCLVEVSLGGELMYQVFSSGLEPGNAKDHIRRQIRIEQPANNPFIVRFTRTKGASSPFYMLRFSVLRQIELYPGTAVELARLADGGSSSLPSGGGRLIPAGTQISYTLKDFPSSETLCLVENEGNASILLDGIKLDPISEEAGTRIFKFNPVKTEDSKISVKADTPSRLIRTSFYFSFQNIDPTSELGKILGKGKTDVSGVSLEDGFEVKNLLKGQIFSAFASDPASLTIEGSTFNTKHGFAWCTAPQTDSFKITGKGDIYSWSLESDPDSDSLPTSFETLIGTDPTFGDTDRDTILDGKDMFPLDADNDGLNDEVENFMGSSRSSFDTNSDAIADGLGLDGASRVEVCSRITDTITPGAKFLDVENPALLATCRLFGNSSLVIPFKELLLSRTPETVLDSWIAKASGAYGILLDDCSVSKEYWADPAFIDTYQIWSKRIWADPSADDDAAYKLGQFCTQRVSELIDLARAKTAAAGLKLAVSIPSLSADNYSIGENLSSLDRVIITATNRAESFQDGLADGQMIGLQMFVHLPDGIAPDHARSYISGLIAAGNFRGTSSADTSQLYLAKTIGSDQSGFIQLTTGSTYWVPKLDHSYAHKIWTLELYNQETSVRPCPVERIGSAKVALLDESTTIPTFEQALKIAEWIRQGGSLLVYNGPSRFSKLTWWGERSTLGKEISLLLGIKDIESEKVMKGGTGNIMLTSVEPTSSVPRFFTDIIESLPKPPCYYCPPGIEAVESGFVSVKYLQKQDLPRFANPVYVPLEQNRFPYIITSTCSVPWLGKYDSKITVLAQSRGGQANIVAIGLSGEPKAITSTREFTSVFQNGVLVLSFTGSDGGVVFAIDTSEALDLKATNCTVSPSSFVYGDTFTVMAAIQNVSKIPASQFSVTFHVDSPEREKQIKRVIVPMLAPKQFINISFEVPPMVEPGDHRIFAVVVADGELNLSNNTTYCDFTVKAKAKERKIVMRIGSQTATIDDKETTLSSPPYIESGRTMVPFRFIAEALDAQVSWDQSEKMVTIVKGDITIYLWIGRNYAIVHGDMVNLTAPPVLKNGKTFVPMRFISEALGAKVDWEPLSQTVTVSMVLN